MLFSKRPITIKSESEMSIIDITILPNQLMFVCLCLDPASLLTSGRLPSSAWIIVDIKKTAENRLPLGAPERRLLGRAFPLSALTVNVIYNYPRNQPFQRRSERVGAIWHDEMSGFLLLSFSSQLPFIYPVRSIVASSDGDNVYGVLTFSNEVCAILHIVR